MQLQTADTAKTAAETPAATEAAGEAVTSAPAEAAAVAFAGATAAAAAAAAGEVNRKQINTMRRGRSSSHRCSGFAVTAVMQSSGRKDGSQQLQ